MKLTWLGHACFLVEQDGYSVVFDPYAPGFVPGLPPLSVTADRVICSHGHDDHNYAEAVTCRTGGQADPFRVTAIPTWHDEKQGALRGPNTIHVLEAGGVRIAHFGDIGCPLTPEQVRTLGRLDAALFPVGGYFTLGPEQAKTELDKLDVGLILPMHYRGKDFGFPVLATVEEFTALYDTTPVQTVDSSSVTVSPGEEKRVLLLRCTK